MTIPTPDNLVRRQRLNILGPNLHSTPYVFIVHRAGCRDIARDQRKHGGQGDGGWDAEFASQAAVVDCVYDFLGGPSSEDGDPTLPRDRDYCVAEFDFKPCCEVPER